MQSKTGNCIMFCTCVNFYRKEVPTIAKFISDEIKERSTKDIKISVNPELNFQIENPNVTTNIRIRLRFSRKEVEHRIAELKNSKITQKMRNELIELEKSIPDRATEIDRPDENFVLFALRTVPKSKGKKIEIGDIESALKNRRLIKIFGLMKEALDKPYNMITCSEYIYKVADFIFPSGFTLPAKIPLPSDVGVHFGLSELDGLSIRFKESSIGLEGILVNLEDDDNLSVTIRARYEVSDFKDVTTKAYELTRNISNLLVERVK